MLETSITSILATFRGYPTIDPFGTTSFAVLIFLSGITALISRYSRVSERWRVIIAQLSALLIGAIVILLNENAPTSTGLWPGSTLHPPRADVFAALYMLLAFGFGFAIHGLQPPWTVLRWLTFFSAYFFGGLITVEAIGKARWAYPNFIPESGWIWGLSGFSLVWAVAITLALRRDVQAAKREKRGECVECGYDLRGTTSHQCPECGAIDSRKP